MVERSVSPYFFDNKRNLDVYPISIIKVSFSKHLLSFIQSVKKTYKSDVQRSPLILQSYEVYKFTTARKLFYLFDIELPSSIM